MASLPMQIEFDSAEACLRVTKMALSKTLDKRELEFLDESMRLYASYVLIELCMREGQPVGVSDAP